jgi:hypothetical protein
LIQIFKFFHFQNTESQDKMSERNVPLPASEHDSDTETEEMVIVTTPNSDEEDVRETENLCLVEPPEAKIMKKPNARKWAIRNTAIWNFFTIQPVGREKWVKATCNRCGQSISRGDAFPVGMKAHLQHMHPHLFRKYLSYY